MKFKGLLLVNLAAIALAVFSLPIKTVAQDLNAETRVNVNKNFELNIDRERIQREDYRASTSVRLGEARARGLSLQVGAEVRATQIDLQLNNISGRVRFQADLDPLRERVRSLPSN